MITQLLLRDATIAIRIDRVEKRVRVRVDFSDKLGIVGAQSWRFPERRVLEEAGA